jgi:hypothetical protein
MRCVVFCVEFCVKFCQEFCVVLKLCLCVFNVKIYLKIG